MPVGQLRLILPVEVARKLEDFPNVRLEPPGSPGGSVDLSWKTVHNVAAVVTLVSAVASAPGQVKDLAALIKGEAASSSAGVTCVIEADSDNITIRVTGTTTNNDLAAMLHEHRRFG